MEMKLNEKQQLLVTKFDPVFCDAFGEKKKQARARVENGHQMTCMFRINFRKINDMIGACIDVVGVMHSHRIVYYQYQCSGHRQIIIFYLLTGLEH